MAQKSRVRLFVVGVAMVASLAIGPFSAYLWAPVGLLAVAGGYLIVWATLGRGAWCRTCKKFGVSSP